MGKCQLSSVSFALLLLALLFEELFYMISISEGLMKTFKLPVVTDCPFKTYQ